MYISGGLPFVETGKYEESVPESRRSSRTFRIARTSHILADCLITTRQAAMLFHLRRRRSNLTECCESTSGTRHHLRGSIASRMPLREFQTSVKLDPMVADAHWRLGRLYQSLGRKEEAKAEFDKTSSLHKAENDSIFTKLKAAQEKPSRRTPRMRLRPLSSFCDRCPLRRNKRSRQESTVMRARVYQPSFLLLSFFAAFPLAVCAGLLSRGLRSLFRT